MISIYGDFKFFEAGRVYQIYVCDSVRAMCKGENVSLIGNYTDIGKSNDIFSQQNYFKEQIYLLLEALIVFLNPQSENLANVLSKKKHHYIC